ncbi:Lysophospholipase L1 [Singulisphaera sp. GP187]|uniref:SGNH/GDSL hydrolase family protein n=1 Tax=Singulisphaera sp. GP187 TaxID=1882752 RepID=UPI00092B8FCC|nr:GDSL-type esterase/lipase family protein [Singulisphaera sp. GP187]SIN73574.1 Lysophospholipase L1 [Singulisphaera sp. GP187]
MLHQVCRRSPSPSWFIRFSALIALLFLVDVQARAEAPTAPFPFQDGDRVAWIGSSSTKIGVWPRTLEFLIHTRHPELSIQFKKFTTGGGTFATGLEHIDEWLGEFKPTLVFFNYGGNDASGGDKGVPKFLENMEQCVAKARQTGARVVLVTPQAADVRKSGEAAAAKRQKYAELMILHGRENGWHVVDTHHPLGAMQAGAQTDDPTYSMLKDKIHLTDSAYIGWGYLLYDLLAPPAVESAATISAGGRVLKTTHCQLLDVSSSDGVLAFTRADAVLPILPPIGLPPRRLVPMEAQSQYLLKVTELPPGKYELTCEGQAIGTVEADALGRGINLNSLLLDANQKAPWQTLAEQVWNGTELEQVGTTRWRFEIRKK